MTRLIDVRVVDDLEGAPATETVRFGLDGRSYTVDLSAAHVGELRSILMPYIDRTRTSGGFEDHPDTTSGRRR